MDSDEESDEPLRLHLVLGAVVLVRSSYVVLPRMSYVILFFKNKLVNTQINDFYIYIYTYIGLFLMVKLGRTAAYGLSWLSQITAISKSTLSGNSTRQLAMTAMAHLDPLPMSLMLFCHAAKCNNFTRGYLPCFHDISHYTSLYPSFPIISHCCVLSVPIF